MSDLKVITYEQAKKYKSMIAKDGVSLENTKDTTYFFYKNIGMCAIYKQNDRVGRLKSVFIGRKHRGEGHGTEMCKQALQYAKDVLGLSEVRLFAFKPNVYKRLAFSITKTYNDGRYFMTKTL